jgi:hypothetical protein
VEEGDVPLEARLGSAAWGDDGGAADELELPEHLKPEKAEKRLRALDGDGRHPE